MYDIPRYHTFTFCRLIHKLYFCSTLKNKMATINDLKAKLIQEDKLMSIERINEIREKNILSYIKSFIGQQGDFIRPKTFSDITGISEHSISRILNTSHLRPEQQLRWCLCIWNNWVIIALKWYHLYHSNDTALLAWLQVSLFTWSAIPV